MNPRKATPKTKPVKLSRADRRYISQLRQHAEPKGNSPHTAQETIPYQHMWPDGLCLTDDHHYTKTMQFQDINYQLAQNEDKTAIFEGWCDFLNYFDPSISVQFSFLNLAIGMESFEQSVLIPLKGDDFDSIRQEYAAMLRNQLAKGNNGLTKTKYLTFGIDADNYRAAKLRLERIELDIAKGQPKISRKELCIAVNKQRNYCDKSCSLSDLDTPIRLAVEEIQDEIEELTSDINRCLSRIQNDLKRVNRLNECLYDVTMELDAEIEEILRWGSDDTADAIAEKQGCSA